jgi:thioredoxin-like negative regulator of GroEL
VGEFTGARPEALVRRFIDKSTQGPAPTPANAKNLSPAQKLTQAKQHLKKGRGFEAFVLFDSFPGSAG